MSIFHLSTQYLRICKSGNVVKRLKTNYSLVAKHFNMTVSVFIIELLLFLS